MEKEIEGEGLVKKSFKFTSDREVSALNIPNNWEEINFSGIMKQASVGKDGMLQSGGGKDIDLGGFNLHEAIGKNPECLFVKVFAIKKDEVNDNGDYFNESELKKATKTFIGVPVFVNHQNDDIEKARGKVVHAWYDDDRGGIYTINMVDKVAFPRLARGLEAGYVTGSSMGCSVKYSCCSVCHVRAATAKEFCSHIKERKKRMFNGEHECKYHDRPNAGDEPCPLCGKKKGEKKTNKFKDQPIFEHNYGVKFIEDSFVVNPACHDCLVSDILNPSELQKKVANITDVIKKYAFSVENQEHNDGCSDGSCSLKKIAGVKEIGDLNEAMNKMERVVRSMMAQKSKVSLEYVSDIIKVCADVQKIADELVEMGYARLPSPNDDQVAFGVAEHASPINKPPSAMQGNAPSSSITSQVSPVQNILQSRPSSYSPQTTEYGDDIGRVTKPAFMPKKSEIMKDFVKISHTIRDRIARFEEKIAEDINLGISSDFKATDGNNSVVITSDDDGDMFVSAFAGTRMTKWASVDTLPEEIRQLAINDPTEAAKRLLASGFGVLNWIKENMNTEENKDNFKVAKRKDAADVTTEAQLNESGLSYGARQGDAPSEIGESQLAGGLKHKFVSSPSPTVRHDSPADISEAQLAGKGSFMTRWSSTPDVITEGQWTAVNREVYAKLPSDWTEGTKEYQLAALRNSFKWNDPAAITEDQLDKKASFEAVDLLKAASDGISSAIGFYGLTADQVKKAFSVLGRNNDKAVFSILYNAAPWSVEDRIKEVSLKRYLSKEASSSSIGMEPMDALISGLSDHLGYLPADQVLKAASWIVKEPVAFQTAVDNAADFASFELESSADSDDIFRKAFRESNFPEDGLFKICAAIEDDIKAQPSEGDAFVRAVHKFASRQVADTFGNTELAPISIDIDEDSGIVEATMKVASMLDDEERKHYSEWLNPTSKMNNSALSDMEDRRSKRASVLDKIDQLEKKAQLAGGQMPAGMNPAGMGAGMNLPGGSVPPGTPGVEALTTGPGIPGPGGAPSPAADPLAGLGGDVGAEAEEDEPADSANPPMAVCVICGNNDVDVSGGKSKCKGPGCGSGFSLKVVPASLVNGGSDVSAGEEEKSDADVEKGLGGSGAAMPPAGAMPPVAASAKLDVDALKKVASTIEFGSISPITGTRNTMKVGNGVWSCLDSGQQYIVRVAADTKDPKSVWAQWEWVPAFKKASCSSCERKKNAFVKALSSIGISEAQFDAMPVSKKAETIISMNQNGSIKEIKQASADNDAYESIKKAFTLHGDFPMNDCMEKLARRYGENALAMSGPCEGKNLADCVCGGLAKEKVYTTGLANKVASIWSEKSAMDNCLEDLVRIGMPLAKAAQACDGMKAKYASVEELFAEAMSMDDSNDGDDDNNKDGDGDPFDGSSDKGSDAVDIHHDGDENMEIDLRLHADPEMLSAIEKAISEIMSGVSSGEDDGEKVDFEIDDSDEDDSDDIDEGDFDVDSSSDDEVADDVEMVDGNDENSENLEDDGGVEDSGANKNNMEIKESDMTKMAPKAAESNEDIIHREAMALRRGRVVGVGKLQLDVSKISEVFNKKADTLDAVAPQDVVDFPSSGDGLNGTEDADAPTSGKGKKGLDNPEIPVTSDSEMGDKITGRVAAFESSLAKLAKDMKLQRGNVQDDKDVGDYSKDGIEMTAPSVPSKGGADLDMPSIPAGDGSFEGESEAGYTAEKQNHVTGGDAGSGGDTKTSGVHDELVLKIAARMVEEKVISAMQMPSKIKELSRYQVSQLQDLEKAMFRNASKGLKTASVSGGLEKPLLIADSSSEKNASSDLKSKISSLFRLHRQNEMADQMENTKLRDAFK
jgi:hypothetical protein